MPIVAAALTYGSFGDVLETARLAKRIIDVLRSGGGSQRRQRVISTLHGLCEDMAKVASVVNVDFSSAEGLHLVARLSSEVASCRSMMDEFSARINAATGVLGRVWMALSEERELAEWRSRIAERRHALHILLGALNSIHSHEVGDHLGRVGSQVQCIGSRVDSVEARVQDLRVDVRNVGTLGVLVSAFLSEQVARMGSQIHQVGTDVETLMQRMSLHDVSDPVFFVTDPVGRTITIQLAHCDWFYDLDRILKAHLHHRRAAGSDYIERGDYSVLSSDGHDVSDWDFRGQLKAGKRFDLSIIMKVQGDVPKNKSCPGCSVSLHSDGEIGGWIRCPSPQCGRAYQIYLEEEETTAVEPQHASKVEEDQRVDEAAFRFTELRFFIQGFIGECCLRPGERVFFWSGAGKAVYGTLQRNFRNKDKGAFVEVRLEETHPQFGQTINLP
ncbi:hypothetical protein DFH07DRAFT_858568 [Mycena maculata]|uniref:Ubiquitin-like domain-containing protein n=1 Tax=Mycena maculata TaxID=230809 RepID=A0AAD7HGT5_9AGAR|nr:hypothetical protein DFH07DRAFT_858568 [Mycena maculata]